MAIDYSKMSVYGDTYGTTEQDLDATQQNQETGIGEILIPNINTPYLNQGGNNEFAKIAAANNNIDYNNLIIPSLKSEQESNMFTDAMGNIKSFAEKNKLLSGIMKAGSFIKDPITGAITSLLGMLPEQDPRATATKNFYDENFGLTSSGSVASGIMQGYNPVYGSDFLNKISQGIIPESGYGLAPAMDKRMDNIKNMLGSKYGYSYTNDNQMYKDMLDGKIGGYGIKGHTSAAENYFKIKSIRDKEKIALQAQEKIKADKADKIYKEKLEADAITMAANTKNPDGSTASYNYAGRDNKQGTHTSTKTKEEAATNQDSGRGQQTSAPSRTAPSRSSSYSSSRGSNFGSRFHGAKGGKVRRSYFDGGIVSL